MPCVSPEGIGIPARDLPRIFTPFFRGSNAPERNFDGRGLGLHLAYAIAEAHGGDLTAQSVEGQGSTFTLVLPLASGNAS